MPSKKSDDYLIEKQCKQNKMMKEKKKIEYYAIEAVPGLSLQFRIAIKENK
jgi:hypothetical protein